MRLLILFFLTTALYAKDNPVTYWQTESENAIPEHWQSFLNPNSINFWKEGDYTPPLPLVWAMKEPTTQNIALYKTYLKRRAGILDTFHQALKKDRIDNIEKIIIAFRSDCSACHQLLTELSAHKEVFEKIQLLQVDKGDISLPWPIMKITEQQANQLSIKAVPMVWVKSKSAASQLLEHPGKLFEEFL